MKLVSSLLGTAVARASSDEVMPPHGAAQRDIIPFVTKRYAFNAFPEVEPGAAAMQLPLTFQSGMFAVAKERIPINRLVMSLDGYAVIAKDTDLADVILEDLMQQFDEHLGYRFSESEVDRSYLSQVTVDFAPSFAERMQSINAIGKIVNDALSPRLAEYKLKRLVFGRDSLAPIVGQLGIEQLIIRDFIIERRAGEPFGKHRFFCAAPMRTKEHIALLEKIEPIGIEQN